MADAPYKVGDSACIADPRSLAVDLWEFAGGPSDPTTRLCVELAAWWPDAELEVTITSIERDARGWYCTVQTRQIARGEEFGVRDSDLIALVSTPAQHSGEQQP